MVYLLPLTAYIIALQYTTSKLKQLISTKKLFDMTTAVPVALMQPMVCVTTSRKVWDVVQRTKNVNDLYQNTEVLLRQHIFKQQFLNTITTQIHDARKEAEVSLLNRNPFTTVTYREAREAHEMLGKCIEILRLLSNADVNMEKLPKDFHTLVCAVRELFKTLTECHAHLSNRFDEMDAVQPNVTQSKYLRRISGAERWSSRPSVYVYQV